MEPRMTTNPEWMKRVCARLMKMNARMMMMGVGASLMMRGVGASLMMRAVARVMMRAVARVMNRKKLMMGPKRMLLNRCRTS